MQYVGRTIPSNSGAPVLHDLQSSIETGIFEFANGILYFQQWKTLPPEVLPENRDGRPVEQPLSAGGRRPAASCDRPAAAMLAHLVWEFHFVDRDEGRLPEAHRERVQRRNIARRITPTTHDPDLGKSIRPSPRVHWTAPC